MYRAPIHLLANGGVLVIDDFGRQHVSPRDLLNRWIVPLDRRVDYLSLSTGQKAGRYMTSTTASVSPCRFEVSGDSF
jgi:predicted ATPase with chaperone activity